MIVVVTVSSVRHGVPHVGHERVLQDGLQGAFHVLGQKGSNAPDEHFFHFHQELVLRLIVVDDVGHGQHRVLRRFAVILYSPKPRFGTGGGGGGGDGGRPDETGRNVSVYYGGGSRFGGRDAALGR